MEQCVYLIILLLGIYEACIQNLSLPLYLESFKKFVVVGGGYHPEYSVRFGPRLRLKTGVLAQAEQFLTLSLTESIQETRNMLQELAQETKTVVPDLSCPS